MQLKCRILILFISASAWSIGNTQLPVDSILEQTMIAAEQYDGLVDSYEAEVYMRTYIETVKKGLFYRFTHTIPNFVFYDPKSNEALIETISNLRFTFPNNYVQDVKHVTGTLTGQKDIEMIPFNLLSINVYSETTYDESFVMPLRKETSRYYEYQLQQEYTEGDITYYTISFEPIYESPKLLKGTVVVEQGSWRVIQFQAEGIDLMADFSIEITMGDEWITNYLPTNFTIYRTTSYFGNVIANRHLAHIDYQKIAMRDFVEKEKSLNISDLVRVRLDSVPIQDDSLFWENNRPIPLQAKERDVIEDYKNRINSKKTNGDTVSQNISAQDLAQRVVLNSKYKLRSTQIQYSGLLNPFMLGFSSHDGITYKQSVFFNIDLKDNRNLHIKAFGGYMFKRKELFSEVLFRWNYNPMHLGNVTFLAGIGNPTYSSMFVKEVRDSLKRQGLSFEDISVNYYKDYYFKLFNEVEYGNGLLLGAGVEYHIRKGNRKNINLVPDGDGGGNGVDDLFGTKYSFMPFVKIAWTPEQYYRYEGKQKIPVRSSYPTFKLEMARSFKDILKSTSEFNRIELDINQNIPIGMMKLLQYHIGGGMIINQKTEYFADFVYFAKNNFPENWSDGIGGTFNLLRRNLYNASDSYIQAHVMYEAPFMILKNVPIISEGVGVERLYLSQLYNKQIISYTELGYGFGNRIFNAAIFGSFHKLEFNEIGVKASLAF